ncbi:unnamed protein product [Effrenium voratum]|nr:unnamed protein product [Effrenium voratum]
MRQEGRELNVTFSNPDGIKRPAERARRILSPDRRFRVLKLDVPAADLQELTKRKMVRPASPGASAFWTLDSYDPLAPQGLWKSCKVKIQLVSLAAREEEAAQEHQPATHPTWQLYLPVTDAVAKLIERWPDAAPSNMFDPTHHATMKDLMMKTYRMSKLEKTDVWPHAQALLFEDLHICSILAAALAHWKFEAGVRVVSLQTAGASRLTPINGLTAVWAKTWLDLDDAMSYKMMTVKLVLCELGLPEDINQFREDVSASAKAAKTARLGAQKDIRTRSKKRKRLIGLSSAGLSCGDLARLKRRLAGAETKVARILTKVAKLEAAETDADCVSSESADFF